MLPTTVQELGNVKLWRAYAIRKFVHAVIVSAVLLTVILAVLGVVNKDLITLGTLYELVVIALIVAFLQGILLYSLTEQDQIEFVIEGETDEVKAVAETNFIYMQMLYFLMVYVIYTIILIIIDILNTGSTGIARSNAYLYLIYFTGMLYIVVQYVKIRIVMYKSQRAK